MKQVNGADFCKTAWPAESRGGSGQNPPQGRSWNIYRAPEGRARKIHRNLKQIVRRAVVTKQLSPRQRLLGVGEFAVSAVVAALLGDGSNSARRRRTATERIAQEVEPFGRLRRPHAAGSALAQIRTVKENKDDEMEQIAEEVG
jgi:hypothetical protein